jgi:hypothetical protein
MNREVKELPAAAVRHIPIQKSSKVFPAEREYRGKVMEEGRAPIVSSPV